MMALALSCSFIGRSISSGGSTLYALRFTAGPNPTGTEDGNRIETRIDSSGDPWRVDATVPPIPIGEYLDETLTLYAPNTLYNWQIVPFDEVGDGSTYGPFTTYTRPSVPPSNLVATPVSSSQINLAWTAGNPVTGYRIYAVVSGGTLAPIATVSAATFAYNLTGRDASESYDIAVVGYNDNSAYGFDDAETDKDAAGAFTTATAGAALESAVIDATGLLLTLNFSGPVSAGAGGTTGLALTLSGGAVTAVYDSGIGTSAVVYDLSRAIYTPETGTLAYTNPGNGLEDSQGLDIANITGFAVTNGSALADFDLVDGASGLGFWDASFNVPISTVGASLIVLAVSGESIVETVTNNQGDTFTAAKQENGASKLQVFYCFNPVESANYRVYLSSAAVSYDSIAVASFSGPSAFDKLIGDKSTSSLTSIQPGSQTPAVAPCLSVIALYTGGSATGFAATGYTLGPNYPAASGVNYGVAILYATLPTTSATNPTVSWTNASGVNGIINLLGN